MKILKSLNALRNDWCGETAISCHTKISDMLPLSRGEKYALLRLIMEAKVERGRHLIRRYGSENL